MSHETKAGLVVSCAFLCMVGAVVYLRMSDGGAGTATEAGELPPWPKTPSAPAASERPTKNNSVKGGPQAGSVAPVSEPPRFEKPPDLQLIGASAPAPAAPASQLKANPVGDSLPVAAPLGGGSPLGHDPLPVNDTKVAGGPPVGDLKIGSDAKLDGDAKLPGGPTMGDAKVSGPTNIDPPASHIGDAKLTSEPKIGNDAKTAGEPHAHEPPIGNPFAHANETPSGEARMENQPLPPPGAPEPTSPGFTPGAGAGPPSGDGKADIRPPEQPNNPLGGPHEPPPPTHEMTFPNEPKPASDPKPPEEPKPAGGLAMPPFPGDAKLSGAAPPEPHTPPGLDTPRPPIDSGTPPGSAAPGGVNLGPPEARAIPPVNGAAPNGVNPIGSATPDPRFAPPPMGNPVPDHPAGPAATVGAGTQGNSPAPLGAPPIVASPPIPIGGPPAGAGAATVAIRPPVVVDPRVESFDEETYVCKPSDSFQSICKDKYLSDKYANALLTFNRSHPLSADGIRNEPPMLKAGQPVYIPPMEILEKRYPSLIPDLQARAPSAVGTPMPGVAPLPSSPAPPAVASAAPSYTVRERPETFYEIAQKVWGRAERWGAIWELNRGEFPNPNQPLPLGTVVRLPNQ
jgi:hypothetical protein